MSWVLKNCLQITPCLQTNLKILSKSKDNDSPSELLMFWPQWDASSASCGLMSFFGVPPSLNLKTCKPNLNLYLRYQICIFRFRNTCFWPQRDASSASYGLMSFFRVPPSLNLKICYSNLKTGLRVQICILRWRIICFWPNGTPVPVVS